MTLKTYRGPSNFEKKNFWAIQIIRGTLGGGGFYNVSPKLFFIFAFQNTVLKYYLTARLGIKRFFLTCSFHISGHTKKYYKMTHSWGKGGGFF